MPTKKKAHSFFLMKKVYDLSFFFGNKNTLAKNKNIQKMDGSPKQKLRHSQIPSSKHAFSLGLIAKKNMQEQQKIQKCVQKKGPKNGPKNGTKQRYKTKVQARLCIQCRYYVVVFAY